MYFCSNIDFPVKVFRRTIIYSLRFANRLFRLVKKEPTFRRCRSLFFSSSIKGRVWVSPFWLTLLIHLTIHRKNELNLTDCSLFLAHSLRPEPPCAIRLARGVGTRFLIFTPRLARVCSVWLAVCFWPRPSNKMSVFCVQPSFVFFENTCSKGVGKLFKYSWAFFKPDCMFKCACVCVFWYYQHIKVGSYEYQMRLFILYTLPLFVKTSKKKSIRGWPPFSNFIVFHREAPRH